MQDIKPVKLPEDNGPHDFFVEWWYFNGHLEDKEGKKYAFMDCFFKINPEKVNMPHILPHLIEKYIKRGDYMHFSHSVVSDFSEKKTYKDIQHISLISEDSFKKETLYINYKDPAILNSFSNCEIIEINLNNFYIKNKNLNLYLESEEKPILEGGKGYVGTLEAGSYYYSLPLMKARGNLHIDGKEIEVEGKAWMDHQWANTVYKKEKWTWFCAQFENGTKAVVVDYQGEGGKSIGVFADIMNKKGDQKNFKTVDLTHNMKLWKSKETKAKYPMSWKIKIPEENIVIKTKTILKNQEMVFGPMNYWEGPIRATLKNRNKKIVKGLGFMELVGYPANYNYLTILGKQIKKKILERKDT